MKELNQRSAEAPVGAARKEGRKEGWGYAIIYASIALSPFPLPYSLCSTLEVS